MSEITAHQYPQFYQQLGIDLGRLGCVMLDTDPLVVSDLINPDDLYVSDKHQYIDGIVSEVVPHVTLLYGLMRSGPELQPHVDLWGSRTRPCRLNSDFRPLVRTR